ncbi:MAG: phenylalanine--tRNA ligase subunit alpha [Defluviitaleaceae bacterium]|nr:phenylalanine--tRNA ligase subunit alpha [Defluviitaleaceae bacterium]
MVDINKIKNNIFSVSSLKELEELRVSLLGRKGEIQTLMQGLGKVPKEEKPILGAKINEIKIEIETLIEAKREEVKAEELKIKLREETIDITIPGKKNTFGKRHPLTTTMDNIKEIFIGMGFSIAEGPDIETSYYNFDALNIPKSHPARASQDTFYTEGGYLLRTQTSPVQIRVMEGTEPPIKIIAPGRVFRSDDVDATHSPYFHQIEGLVVDKGITMADLKGTLLAFSRELFGQDVNIRLRPHYFPFTEPSAEMDISCFVCKGEDSKCHVCKGEGFIELLGCGMVHPNVLKAVGIDPAIYSGFAFGLGLERNAMQRFKINDLRLFFENDLNFLKQF